MHWIEPIKEQLNRLERRFEQLSAPGPATLLPKLPRSAPSSRAQLSKPKPSFSAASSPTPSFSAGSSPAAMLSSNDVPPTSDDILEDETVDGCGMCVCVCVCMCACMHACMRESMCVSVLPAICWPNMPLVSFPDPTLKRERV